MFLLSSFLAGTIAEPMRRLAEASDRVRRGTKSRQEIPDFTYRADEIGHLSGSLRDMTKALYNRIEAIERFAADVAHELKNPLTSLRSAVETMPVARTKNAQDRLLAIIQHDVKRLDRLISDISDASRLDAELARADNQEVDLLQILEAVVAVANGTGKDGVRISLNVAPSSTGGGEPSRFLVLGYDSRLGQVFNNLIDNARSFSAHGGSVRVTMRRVASRSPAKLQEDRTRGGYEIIVDDDGPGIPADAFERIFERFYTDRPEQGFGQNSGLGLSISRQIVEVHGGEITALTASRVRARHATTRVAKRRRPRTRTKRRPSSAPASPCGSRPPPVTPPDGPIPPTIAGAGSPIAPSTPAPSPSGAAACSSSGRRAPARAGSPSRSSPLRARRAPSS